MQRPENGSKGVKGGVKEGAQKQTEGVWNLQRMGGGSGQKTKKTKEQNCKKPKKKLKRKTPTAESGTRGGT